MVKRKAHVGEEFEMRLDLVNVGRKPGSLNKIEGIVFPEFTFSSLPSFCNPQEGGLAIREKSIGPFEVETFKLKLSATKAGSYKLNPEVFYEDDLGKSKMLKVNPVIVTVEPAKPAFEVLPGRVTTGTVELDKLLLGGIPQKFAVALTAPSCDEREILIYRFLKAGVEAHETTFLVTAEPGNAGALAETNQLNFYILVCSPRADSLIQTLPNVFMVKGVENLTEIDIALTKAFHTLDSMVSAGSKRACITIVSDILLQHHAVITRKWLNALLPDLRFRGFTTLVVVDPSIHSSEEVRAIVSLFDGEITLSEKESASGLEKTLRARKLYNQEYLKDELTLALRK